MSPAEVVLSELAAQLRAEITAGETRAHQDAVRACSGISSTSIAELADLEGRCGHVRGLRSALNMVEAKLRAVRPEQRPAVT